MCCTNPVITTDLEVNNDNKKNNAQNMFILGNNQSNPQENNGGIEIQNNRGNYYRWYEAKQLNNNLNLNELQVAKLDIFQKKNFLKEITDIAPKMNLRV